MVSSCQPLAEALEKIFGKASQSGFGSAVMHGMIKPGTGIETIALANYKYFLGSKWTTETEKIWLGPWKKVYARKPGDKPDILKELSSLTDADARTSIPLLTDLMEDSKGAKKSLSDAFDHDGMHDMAVFTIGDGDAISGIIVTGICKDDYSMSVIALMD